MLNVADTGVLSDEVVLIWGPARVQPAGDPDCIVSVNVTEMLVGRPSMEHGEEDPEGGTTMSQKLFGGRVADDVAVNLNVVDANPVPVTCFMFWTEVVGVRVKVAVTD